MRRFGTSWESAFLLSDTALKHWFIAVRPLRKRAATGKHGLDGLCADLGIEHSFASPMRPRTNGVAERVDGLIEDVLQSHRIRSGEDLEPTTRRYVRLCNGRLPQSVLKGRTPIDALEGWHRDKPEPFKTRPYNHPGRES